MEKDERLGQTDSLVFKVCFEFIEDLQGMITQQINLFGDSTMT